MKFMEAAKFKLLLIGLSFFFLFGNWANVQNLGWKQVCDVMRHWAEWWAALLIWHDRTFITLLVMWVPGWFCAGVFFSPSPNYLFFFKWLKCLSQSLTTSLKAPPHPSAVATSLIVSHSNRDVVMRDFVFDQWHCCPCWWRWKVHSDVQMGRLSADSEAACWNSFL